MCFFINFLPAPGTGTAVVFVTYFLQSGRQPDGASEIQETSALFFFPRRQCKCVRIHMSVNEKLNLIVSTTIFETSTIRK